MKSLAILCIFLFSGFCLPAQDVPAVPEDLTFYAGYLGMTIEQAVKEFGAPDHMFAYQGEEDESGSVVFDYRDSFSLFWIDDRVWQLRLDGPFSESGRPSLIGQPISRIIDQWGTPQFRDDTLLIYDIPESDYPVRCALYFGEEGDLIDMYIFRGDY